MSSGGFCGYNGPQWKIKESEKMDKYLDLCQRAEKAVEHEADFGGTPEIVPKNLEKIFFELNRDQRKNR